MKSIVATTLLLCVFHSAATNARAHQSPIETLVNSNTNRMFVIEGFSEGVLAYDGNDVVSNGPSIGSSSPFNGLTPQTQLGLQVTQALLFWDGNDLAIPNTGVTIINPSFTEDRYVTTLTGPLTQLPWAAYSGNNGWDAHGQFLLDSISATSGIYGLAVRITSTHHEPTKPFLIPLVYDPLGELANISAGIAMLRSAINVPADADFQGDLDVDGSDFLRWQQGYFDGNPTPVVLPSEGDADLDSDVDHQDLAFWQQQYATGPPPTSAAASAIPEPHSVALATACLIFASAIRFRITIPLR